MSNSTRYLSSKLIDERKVVIKLLLKRGNTQVDIAKILNITRQRVSDICNNDTELKKIIKGQK